MANTMDNKKEMLDIRLIHSDTDSPDTLRVVEEARIGMGIAQNAPSIEPQEAAAAANEPSANPGGSNQHKEAEKRALSRRILDKIVSVLGGVLPKRGDPPLEIIRKCIFDVALITLIVSLSYIINDMVLIPLDNSIKYSGITDLYNPDNPVPPPADFPEDKYPEGISDSFKALYAQNQQIRGWMKYTDLNNKWLKINYPVMFSGNNDYYLNHDFQKAKNKNGALFFDKSTDLESYGATNRVLIVYGHNMASGQMLSPLNKLLNNLNYMRSAPLISLDTLYKRGEYEVFSVMLLNTREEDGPYFDYLRTRFRDDEDFMDFVKNIRARSIYNFNAVDVQAGDELLILSTCTALSNAHFKDGRCVVVARRVRDGETVALRTTDIVNNKNVIMPLAWYLNQKKTPHKFYTDSGYTIPGVTVNTRQPSGDGPTYTAPTTYPRNPGSSTAPRTSDGTSAGGSSNPSGGTGTSATHSGTGTTASGSSGTSTGGSGSTEPTSGDPSSGTTITDPSSGSDSTGETTTTTEPEPTDEPEA